MFPALFYKQRDSGPTRPPGVTGLPRFSGGGARPRSNRQSVAACSKTGGELFETDAADCALKERFEALHPPDETQLLNQT